MMCHGAGALTCLLRNLSSFGGKPSRRVFNYGNDTDAEGMTDLGESRFRIQNTLHPATTGQGHGDETNRNK